MRFGREVLDADLYGVLGLEPWATADQLRRAYRRAVLRTHPDLDREDPAAAQLRMAALNVAAGILLDPARRSAYDRLRAERRSGRAKPRPIYSWPASTEGGGDWAVPARGRAWARAIPEARELLRRLRPWPARLAEELSSSIEQWTPRRHAAVMAVSIVMALGLIAEARPTLLVQLFTPDRVGYASTR